MRRPIGSFRIPFSAVSLALWTLLALGLSGSAPAAGQVAAPSQLELEPSTVLTPGPDSVRPSPRPGLEANTAHGWKSPGRAVLYSFLGTALPVGIAGATALGNNEFGTGAQVVVAGAIVGPSLGHFYAHKYHRAIRGILIRGAAAATIYTIVNSDDPNDISSITNHQEALFLGAGLLGVTYVVVDILGAAHSARAQNQALAERARLEVTPWAGSVGGAPGAGVSVAY